jgi:hypothetical protein
MGFVGVLVLDDFDTVPQQQIYSIKFIYGFKTRRSFVSALSSSPWPFC